MGSMPTPQLPTNQGTDNAEQRSNRSPLEWHYAGACAIQLGEKTENVAHSMGWEEFGYGRSTVELIRAVLPELQRVFTHRISQILL